MTVVWLRLGAWRSLLLLVGVLTVLDDPLILSGIEPQQPQQPSKADSTMGALACGEKNTFMASAMVHDTRPRMNAANRSPGTRVDSREGMVATRACSGAGAHRIHAIPRAHRPSAMCRSARGGESPMHTDGHRNHHFQVGGERHPSVACVARSPPLGLWRKGWE